MKTLEEYINESILSDIDTTLARSEHDIILSKLFSSNLQWRREALNDLLLLVESYHPNRCTTKAKIKNSNSYCVEFTYPMKIENGEVTGVCDWISYIKIICKRTSSSYILIDIDATGGRHGDKISISILPWNYAILEFNPKSSYNKIYEVPDKLNDLFKRIQMKAYNNK